MIKILSNEPLLFKERKIVVIQFEDGTIQPFYKRSNRHKGENSEGAKSGDWAPFNGLLYSGWFIKNMYATKAGFPKDHPLYRFGSEENKRASKEIAEIEKSGWLKEPTEVDTPVKVNNYLYLLGYKEVGSLGLPRYSVWEWAKSWEE